MNPQDTQINLAKSIASRRNAGQDVTHSQMIYDKVYGNSAGNKPTPTATPLGIKARTPQTNVSTPSRVLPSSQTAPTVTPVPPAPAPVAPIPTNTNNGLYGSLINRGVDALNQSAALTGKMETAKQNVAGNPNYSLDTQVGRQGLIQQNIGTQATALANQGQAFFAGAGEAKPQVASYGQTAFNPVSNTFGVNGSDPLEGAMSTYAQLAVNGQGSQIPGAITSNPELQARLTQAALKLDPNFDWNRANARGSSVGGFETQIQGIKSKVAAASANFENLRGYATGFAGGTPIINGIKQLYGTSAQGSTAIAGFQSQLQSVRQAWSEIVGGDPLQAIPDNVTPDQLAQIQKTLEDSAKNNLTNLQSQASAQTQSGQGGGSSDPLGIR